MNTEPAIKSKLVIESGAVNLARNRAERAALELSQVGSIYAVLLATDWQVLSIPFIFEHLDDYEEIAKRVGCSLVTVKRDDSGGLEHLLFMTRLAGLDDDQYLECMNDTADKLDYTLPRRTKDDS
ncbi:MAG: hypothetical protein ABL949_15080 [Fimbriimonadaceae bacterium]